MNIILQPGESVTVEFHDSDGTIIVAFDEDAIRVKADLPDTSERVGVIYEEIFVSMWNDSKSDIVKRIAEKHGISVDDVSVTETDPTDLMGLPDEMRSPPEVTEAIVGVAKSVEMEFAGYHQFRSEDGSDSYGSFEVHYVDKEVPTAEEPIKVGWYWRSCFPGCLPDGDDNGPFPTSEGAYLDALESDK